MKIMDYLCDVLCVDKAVITGFSLTAPHRYKVYEINKRRSSGKRIIAHPSKELKFIQRLIVKKMEGVLPVHECAFAYKCGVGIKDNARVHLRTKYLLKMDFEDYFPSITPDLMFSIMDKIGVKYDGEDQMLLANLLFRKSRKNSSLRLSIGAPSSPLISNFILLLFDEEIKNECDKRGVRYTRYADDLTFSTNVKTVLFEIPDIVKSVLLKQSEGRIKVNHAKTIFSSKAHNRHVTGVTLSNDNTLSVGRERKRLISSMIHKFQNNALDEESIFKLQGLFSFAKHIEPSFYGRMCRKYGDGVLINLIKYKA